jgi:hypothetical protein
VTWGYSIDTTAGPITFSTSTGLLSIESSDVADDGVHNYVISVTLTEVSSSTLFQTLTYNLAVAASYTPSDVYVGSLQTLPITHTYTLGDAEETVNTYAIDCDNTLTGNDCIEGSEVNYVISIDDVGLTSSSDPISFDPSTGELKVHSDQVSDSGTSNFVITIKLYEGTDQSVLNYTFT